MSFFKAYDMRGTFGTDFDLETVHEVGKALVQVVTKGIEKPRWLVGRDGRTTGAAVRDALVKGLEEAGAEVTDIGLSTTPMVYFHTATGGYDGSVMVTASHNPPGDNGLKVSRRGALPVGYADGLDEVERIVKAALANPFRAVGRDGHPADSVIDCGGVKLGGGNFAVIAGPCCIESEERLFAIAEAVKKAGATLLRGGAFKPRTSPYDFQGLGREGLAMLVAAKKATGLPIVTELVDFADIDAYNDVDVIQIGARNMQNVNLLKEVGAHTKKPVLLKRGMSATLEELLLSAEYILNAGNPNVILCERGIRTFETAMRNTLDLAAVPYLHTLTHLPVIIDPSHATGHAALVEPVSVAAAAIGADGLIIEVHDDPPRAKCDGVQSQTPAMFAATMARIRKIREAL